MQSIIEEIEEIYGLIPGTSEIILTGRAETISFGAISLGILNHEWHTITFELKKRLDLITYAIEFFSFANRATVKHFFDFANRLAATYNRPTFKSRLYRTKPARIFVTPSEKLASGSTSFNFCGWCKYAIGGIPFEAGNGQFNPFCSITLDSNFHDIPHRSYFCTECCIHDLTHAQAKDIFKGLRTKREKIAKIIQKIQRIKHELRRMTTLAQKDSLFIFDPVLAKQEGLFIHDIIRGTNDHDDGIHNPFFDEIQDLLQTNNFGISIADPIAISHEHIPTHEYSTEHPIEHDVFLGDINEEPIESQDLPDPRESSQITRLTNNCIIPITINTTDSPESFLADQLPKKL